VKRLFGWLIRMHGAKSSFILPLASSFQGLFVANDDVSYSLESWFKVNKHTSSWANPLKRENTCKL